MEALTRSLTMTGVLLRKHRANLWRRCLRSDGATLTACGRSAGSMLVTVLARSFRVINAGVDEIRQAWSLRPVPSGGAAHPFDLLVTATEVHGLTSGHYVYGPNAVSLRGLSTEQKDYADLLTAVMVSASRRLEPAPASICLVANVERTAAADVGLRSCIVGSAGYFEHLFSLRSPNDGSRPYATVVDCGGLVLGGA